MRILFVMLLAFFFCSSNAYAQKDNGSILKNGVYKPVSGKYAPAIIDKFSIGFAKGESSYRENKGNGFYLFKIDNRDYEMKEIDHASFTLGQEKYIYDKDTPYTEYNYIERRDEIRGTAKLINWNNNGLDNYFSLIIDTSTRDYNTCSLNITCEQIQDSLVCADREEDKIKIVLVNFINNKEFINVDGSEFTHTMSCGVRGRMFGVYQEVRDND